MATVVSFINYKGGVGKTTLAVEISASLAYHQKKRVLLVDLDPQTNATFYLVTVAKWKDWANEDKTLKSIFTAAMDEPPQEIDVHNVIHKDFLRHPRTHEIVSLHLLPSHIELMSTDMDLAMKFGARGFEARRILRTVFEKIKDDYDYIICDCPPNLNLITQNAILASNGITVVAMPEYLSTLGISEIEKAVKKLVGEVNRSIEGFGKVEEPTIKGIIFNRVSTKYGGTVTEQGIMERVRETWGDIVFKEFVSHSVKLAESAEPSKSPIAISGYAADSVYEEQLKKCASRFSERN
ncbi:MAG: AAA family ATPase [Pseudanabaena sp. Salubria-1]|nr:AAA family ATPase [Pseudanabaena sp. Salubria-1]